MKKLIESFFLPFIFLNLVILPVQIAFAENPPANNDEVILGLTTNMSESFSAVSHYDDSVQDTDVEILVEKETPNFYKIDQFRKFDSEDIDNESKVAYALRTTALVDFLHTRLALKELLANDKESELRHGEKIDFSVPYKTKRLLNYNSIYPIQPAGSLIKNIEQRNYEYNFKKRMELIHGLTVVSVSLAKLDMELKFLTEDLWDNQKFKDVAQEYYQDYYNDNAQVGSMSILTSNLRRAKELAKKEFINHYGLNDKIEMLLAQRSLILNQYPILSESLKGEPFYKRIYNFLSENFEFPSLKLDQKVATNLFPKKSLEMYRPFEIDDQGNAYTNSEPTEMEYHTEFESSSYLSFEKLGNTHNIYRITRSFNKDLDSLLLKALEANTKNLEIYSTEKDYYKDRKKFLDLALYPSLWESSKKYFEFVKEEDINWEDGQSKMIAEIKRKIKVKRNWTIGIAVLGAGITIGSFGLGAYLGLPLIGGAVGIGVGLGNATVTGLAAFTAYDSSGISRRAGELLYGSKYTGDYDYYSETMKVSANAQRDFMITLILLGTPGRLVDGVLKATAKAFNGVKSGVVIPFSKIPAVQKAIGNSIIQLKKLGDIGLKMAKPVLNYSANLLKTLGYPELAMAEMYLLNAQTALKLTRVQLAGKLRSALTMLKEAPILGKHIGKIEASVISKIADDPFFISNLVRALAISEFMSASTNFVMRGPEGFKDDWVYVLNSLITTGVLTSALVFITTGGKTSTVTLSNMHKVLFKNSKKLFLTSIVFASLSGLASGSLAHAKAPDEISLKEAYTIGLQNAVYTAFFVAISSNLRSTVLYWAQPKLHQYAMANNQLSSYEQTMVSLEISSNMFGSISSYYGASLLGINQSDYEYRDDEALIYSRDANFSVYMYSAKNASNYLYDFLY